MSNSHSNMVLTLKQIVISRIVDLHQKDEQNLFDVILVMLRELPKELQDEVLQACEERYEEEMWKEMCAERMFDEHEV